MDKFDNEANGKEQTNNNAEQIGEGIVKGEPNNPNKELENVLLGKVDNPKEDKEIADAEEARMKDIYMDMTSEMADEVTPSEDDPGLEKDSDQKFSENSDQDIFSSNKNTAEIADEITAREFDPYLEKDGDQGLEKISNKDLFSSRKNTQEMAKEITPENDKGIEKKEPKKTNTTMWILIIVAGIIIAALGYGWFTTNNNITSLNNSLGLTKNELEGVYYKSFDNVASNMNDLEKKLAKVQIVSSEKMYVTLFTEIWSTSNMMRVEVGQLPLQTDVANDLSSFITQTGDYSYMLTKKVLNGQEITAADQQQLYELQLKCADLANMLSTMRAENKVVFVSATEQAAIEAEAENEENPLDVLKQSTQQYPTLIYDGPFSDSTKKQTAKSVENAAEITPEAAVEIAKNVAGQGSSNIVRDEDVEGKLPAYTYTLTLSNGVNATINITKKGGMPLYMIQETDLQAAIEVPSDEIIAKGKATATAYLETIGYKNMQPNYIQYYSGALLINFTPVVDKVTIYPDIIKVWVDISSFSITGLDAKNYIYSHVNRSIKTPKLTAAQAKAYVSKNLTVDSQKLCLIPNETLTEDFCYEFSGIYKEQRFLVYIDANTGAEKQVMQIQDTDQGQLVE